MSMLRSVERLNRPQTMALTSGLANLAMSLLHIFPLTPAEHTAQLVTGLCGIALAWRADRARLFGLAVILGYGAVYLAHSKTGGLIGSWWPLRMVVTGAVITFMPASGQFASKR